MKPRFNFTRLDSADAYFLTQQLESLDPTKYYELVPSRQGRRFMSPIENVSPYDPVYKYVMTKLRGRAKKTGPKAKDAPSVSVVRTEHTQQIKTFETEFGWTVDEIRAAKQKSLDLDTDKFQAAVVAIEQSIDGTLALGDSDSGIPGLANNDDVDTTTPVVKTGGGDWLSAATKPSEIIADIALMLTETRAALKSASVPGQQMPMFQKFTLLLPQDHLTKIATTPRSDTSDTTILDYVLENFRRWLVAVEDWWQLDEADSGHGMGVMYPSVESGSCNPFAGGALLPLDFEQLNPQESGRDIVIPAAGKCGGFVNRFPVAFRYIAGARFAPQA